MNTGQGSVSWAVPLTNSLPMTTIVLSSSVPLPSLMESILPQQVGELLVVPLLDGAQAGVVVAAVGQRVVRGVHPEPAVDDVAVALVQLQRSPGASDRTASAATAMSNCSWHDLGEVVLVLEGVLQLGDRVPGRRPSSRRPPRRPRPTAPSAGSRPSAAARGAGRASCDPARPGGSAGSAARSAPDPARSCAGRAASRPPSGSAVPPVLPTGVAMPLVNRRSKARLGSISPWIGRQSRS